MPIPDNSQILYDRPTFPAQLDMSHPLTKGLVGCWVMNENDPNSMRVWDSSPYKNHGLCAGTQGRWGGRFLIGSNSDWINTGLTIDLGEIYSLVVWINHNTTSRETIMGRENAANVAQFEVAANNQPQIIRVGAVQALSNYSGSIGQFLCCSYSHWGINAGNHVLYVNGVDHGLTAESNASNSGAGIITFGRRAAASQLYNGIISLALVYLNRVLNANENKQLYTSPYDMFLK